MIAIVIVAAATAAAAVAVLLTWKIPIRERTRKKGKTLTIKRNIFTRVTDIKGNGVVTNTSTNIRRLMAMLNMIEIKIVITEKGKLEQRTKIRVKTIQGTIKYKRSIINNHFNNILI